MTKPHLPYVHLLGDRNPREVLEETPARLKRALAGRSADELERHPAPGKWNLREVMAHLADCEIAWAWRLRYALEQERAQMQPFDQDAWARMYDRYTFGQAQATFEALRGWNVMFICGLSEENKQRPYVHPERGEEVLWNVVEIMAGHDLHHLATLQDTLNAM